MIFVTLGSQKFQMNRILLELDRLVNNGSIEDSLYAQIGYSEYKPKHFESKKFLLRQDYINFIKKSKIVITHGGTGAIVGALKKNKKVIAIPRETRFGEHVDDHQSEIVNMFEKQGLIVAVNNEKNILEAIHSIDKVELKPFISHKEEMLKSIKESLNQLI